MKINHVGLIPDGNRRWAQKNSIDYFSAYKISMQNVKKFLEIAIEQEIKNISVYLLSKQNLSRKREDLQAVLKAEEYLLSDILPEFCMKFNCSATFAGDINCLPNDLQKALLNLCDITSKNKKIKIFLLVGYDPFDEVNSVTKEKKREIFLSDLWVPERLDCVIRTAGGPTLLSNFLPLQSGYAQIYMIDKYFNDCTEEDFLDIFEQTNKVIMLFGK